jgi:hypothetical protein
VLELPLHSGLFLTLGIHDWATLEEGMCFLAERPDLARQIMLAHGRFIAANADRVLREVQIDFASFSEPIGSPWGPLVSPAMYRSIALESYAPIIEVLRRHHVPAIAFITYANARPLLRDVVAAGFNTLWAIESDSPAMDYLSIRREFGRNLRLIGGIDLDLLSGDAPLLKSEMHRIVPPLLAEGGYVPLADGRVRANTSWANYRLYRGLLHQLAGSPGR